MILIRCIVAKKPLYQREDAGQERSVADRVTPERRSQIMSAIRSTNTKPEMAVRRVAHALGYRFRLHRCDLPGAPDLVFPARQAIIFVHGCYWHGHGCTRGGSGAKSNQHYWGPKIARNRERDAKCQDALVRAGWRVMVIWECETKDIAKLKGFLRIFLD
jgi:DNA mismatch endonuclease (patch repair protein)